MSRSYNSAESAAVKRLEYEGKPSQAVITAISELTESSPLDLPPLSESVSADGLDLLFESPVTSLTVSFEYVGYDVTVTTDRVRITEA